MPTIRDRIDNVKDTALEVGVYLPLGAYSKVRDQIGDLDTRKVKRFYGNLVDRGQRRAEPFERSVRRNRRRVERKAEATADEVRSQVKATSRKGRSTVRSTADQARRTTAKAGARAEATADTVAPKLPRVATPRRASELPIQRYDSLTASEIAAATKGLTQTELAKIYKYEKANEDRATVLGAVEAKFVDLPIPSYDALNADEIADRLEGLNDSELKTIRRYENDTKGRATILEKIDALLGANA